MLAGKILDGNKVAQVIRGEIKEKISKTGANPVLHTNLVGEDSASKAYVEIKKRACGEVGIENHVNLLPSSVRRSELIELIKELNPSNHVDAILIQLPLPSHFFYGTVGGLASLTPTCRVSDRF